MVCLMCDPGVTVAKLALTVSSVSFNHLSPVGFLMMWPGHRTEMLIWILLADVNLSPLIPVDR